jgi:hypothetical protein
MKYLLTALLLTPLAVLHGADLLPLTPAAMTQLDRAQKAGLIEIAPVHLPPPDAADCNHYGWPIATMTGDTIVVMHRRIPGHKAAGAGSTSSSTAATPTVLPASFASAGHSTQRNWLQRWETNSHETHPHPRPLQPRMAHRAMRVATPQEIRKTREPLHGMHRADSFASLSSLAV